MAGFHAIMNSKDLHHCLISKIWLGINRRAIIIPNNLPLELNQLTPHQILPTAAVLHAASSTGRVMQPYHFTIMLVLGHVALK
jgi:hypothetical protein